MLKRFASCRSPVGGLEVKNWWREYNSTSQKKGRQRFRTGLPVFRGSLDWAMRFKALGGLSLSRSAGVFGRQGHSQPLSQC